MKKYIFTILIVIVLFIFRPGTAKGLTSEFCNGKCEAWDVNIPACLLVDCAVFQSRLCEPQVIVFMKSNNHDAGSLVLVGEKIDIAVIGDADCKDSNDIEVSIKDASGQPAGGYPAGEEEEQDTGWSGNLSLSRWPWIPTTIGEYTVTAKMAGLARFDSISRKVKVSTRVDEKCEEYTCGTYESIDACLGNVCKLGMDENKDCWWDGQSCQGPLNLVEECKKYTSCSSYPTQLCLERDPCGVGPCKKTADGSGCQAGVAGDTIGEPGQPGQDVTYKFEIKNPLNANDVFELINMLSGYLVGLAIPAGVIMIIYAAFLFLTAGAYPENVTKARNILLYAVIGLAIIFIGKGFISLVQDILGVAQSPSVGAPGIVNPNPNNPPPDSVSGGKWICVSDLGDCIEDETGNFGTYEACSSACASN